MRRGFSLFELIVALGLSVALMTMIGYAMQFYAESLRERDSEIERTQVVRSVMHMIASDLRGCLNPPEFDSSALEAVLASTAAGGSGGSGGSRSGGGGDGGGGGDSAPGGDDDLPTGASDTELDPLAEEEPVDVSSSDLMNSSVVLSRPGLIGNQYQIQIDVSRLPRMEDYIPMLTQDPLGSVRDKPSDIKTVSYYIVGPGVLNDQFASDPNQPAQPGGLARRELDRLINKFAVENGNVLGLEQTAELVAPEIAQIEFQYWDGVQWLYEWHSDEYGGLPRAIQVRLTLAPPADAADASELEMRTPEVFDMIVPIPSAAPIETAEDPLLTEEGV